MVLVEQKVKSVQTKVESLDKKMEFPISDVQNQSVIHKKRE